MLFRYSQIERVKTVDEIRHPIIREALKLTGVAAPDLEIASIADIPAGTGLGSSGSFTTCLLKVPLQAGSGTSSIPRELAEMACHIELDCEGADRQAGPVHRRVRRRDGVRFSSGRAGRRPSAQRRPTRSSTCWRTTW